MYKETKEGSHIWEVKDLEEYKDGWYFSDETEGFNGPYNTEIEAAAALASYCDWLDKGAPNEATAVDDLFDRSEWPPEKMS